MHFGAHCGNTVVTVLCSIPEVLSAKLHFCGIQGMGASWFGLGLTNRRRKVEIGSSNATKIFFFGGGGTWGTFKHRIPKGGFCRMPEKLPYKLLHVLVCVCTYLCVCVRTFCYHVAVHGVPEP